MTEEKKRSYTPLILVVIPTLVGLILGYLIWGSDRHKQEDYKQNLQDTINYIATIENKNEELGAKVDSLETEVGMLRQKNQQPADDNSGMVSTLSQRVRNLEAENQRLRQQVRNLTQVTNTTGRVP